ncbi:tetratricopeptide repeat protein [uncultured Methanoregula sp.]|uniref:tetratricopeptide repeat protein n=1 Tax=uncultured Methanoregula sp. TaxID=1005933 RepID=UPI002AABB9E9|nr:tetratricopeptide repeat protein [uncultured Methanoregula sp.]
MPPEEPRRIRVFISSTFRDMQEERDELAKRVFPALRKLCEERDIEWGEVDLRWGITEDQAERGEVLPICLAEIDRCKPYIIGILGERYGWVPDEIPEDLRNQQPWLNGHFENSVTALEILHGVLNNPAMAGRSFFYFRDPAYIETIPKTRQQDFLECPTADEIRLHGTKETGRRVELRREKLLSLKEEIRKSGIPVRENYRNPREFGSRVLQDLLEVIEQFPPPGKRDALDRETAVHETFAKSRFGIYIERQHYFDTLDAHARGNGPPLVILGDSGSGKSALLAHWVKRYREGVQTGTTEKSFGPSPSEIQPLVLIHFIGASEESTDYVAMLRRIMGELRRHFRFDEEIPERPEEIRAAFANWLHMAAARGKVILIIDALNQLEDRDGAPDLVWLPTVIPSNIRLIVSTLPGRSLDSLKERGWPAMNVEPLAHDEQEELIRFYLAQYRRTPSVELVQKISNASQSKNPLYLRCLLEELRLYGDHDTLMAEAERYLRAREIDGLFCLILERWEKDFNRDRPELVQDVMKLIWASRRGLSEPELLDMTGRDGNPMPGAFWSPLSLSMEKALINRSGLLGFFHDYLKKAVEARYLGSESARNQAHLRIAGYFETPGISPRALEELPWQYDRAGAWDLLHVLLRNLNFFQHLWTMNPYDVKMYWADLETRSLYRMVETYRDMLHHPEEYGDSTWNLATLFSDTGNLKEGLILQQFLTRFYRERGDRGNYQASLGNQAGMLRLLARFNEAMELLREQEQICRETGNRAGLCRSLGSQATILSRVWAKPDEAIALHKEEERICRETGDRPALQASLGNQADILKTWGRLEEALELLKEQERICQETGNRAGLSRSLCGQASILMKGGRLEEAMELHREEERICREIGDREMLSACLGNQALILRIWGRLEEAMELHREVERICRETGDLDGLEISLGARAMILRTWSRLEEALELLKEQERICRETGNRARMLVSLGNRAIVLADFGDLDGAMKLHKEEEQICRETGDTIGLLESLVYRAHILYDRSDLNGALALYTEAEKVCRETGNNLDLYAPLANRANILYTRGDLAGAEKAYAEAEKICRETGNKDGLSSCLSNRSNILFVRSDFDGAMTLLKEAEQISRELNNKNRLQFILQNQGLILKNNKDPDGALALYAEAGQICRETGDKNGLSTAIQYRADILAERDDPDSALALYTEAEQICRETGDKNGLQAVLTSKGELLKAKGDPDGALALHTEAEQICRELKNVGGLSLSLYYQALLFFKQGKNRKALDYAEEAYRLADETGITIIINRIKPSLEEIRRACE